MKQALVLIFCLISMPLVYSNCTPAAASGATYAIQVSGPEGVRCYAIVTGADAHPVGGNCLPE